MWRVFFALMFAGAVHCLAADSLPPVSISFEAGALGVFERGPNFGSTVEFVSTIERSRRQRNGGRTDLSLDPISNGSFDNRNPSTETIRLFWAVPLGC